MINIPNQLINHRFIKTKEKIPVETNWQKEKNYTLEDENFKLYTQYNRTYGVLCGYNNLLVVDFDNEGVQNELKDIMPETFTIKSASGRLHLYYYVDDAKSFKAMDKDKNTLFDCQGIGKQVIGAGSRLEDGRTYSVLKDVKIAYITSKELHKYLDGYNYVEPIIENKTSNNKENPTIKAIQEKLTIKDYLNELNINTNVNPCKCPLHPNGGRNLSFNDEKGVWNCFNCGKKGNIVHLYQFVNKIEKYGEAVNKLCEKYGIENNRKEYSEFKPEIVLPKDDILISDFANELGRELSKKQDIFFKPTENEIVKINTIKDELTGNEYTGFLTLTSSGFITHIEKHITPVAYKPNLDKDTKAIEPFIKVSRSLGKDTSKIVLDSDNFKHQLPKIMRILSVPKPIIKKDKLVFPKKGYDEEFKSWLPHDSPEIITECNVDEAKKLINDLFSEFCFKEEQDKVNAIAYLLTPFLRGLYSRPTIRTPIFLIEGNRERAGKDYLAGCVSIVYEGKAIEEPAISGDDNNKTSHSEELRKKILGFLKSGRTRLHFSNNRGHLANTTLEGFATAETWNDRILGKNEEISFNNETEISLSANSGLTYTPDLKNRCIRIKLLLDLEDANARVFKHPNLHEHIRKNRGLILSALYKLVDEWNKQGRPNGSKPFTSFPEWAKICGGIMECNGLGNPCVPDKELLSIGGDTETNDFKTLFEMCYLENPNKWIKKNIIREIASKDENIFVWIDFNDKSGQTKFALKLEKYVDRIFSGIKLLKDSTSKKSSDHTFKFIKIEEMSKINKNDTLIDFNNKNVEINKESPQPTQPQEPFLKPSMEKSLNNFTIELYGKVAEVTEVAEISEEFVEDFNNNENNNQNNKKINNLYFDEAIIKIGKCGFGNGCDEYELNEIEIYPGIVKNYCRNHFKKCVDAKNKMESD